MLSASRDILTISLHICIPFTSFSSCFIALAKHSRTMLTQVSRVGILFSYLPLEEMFSVFPY
jgi:hypothetical protein